MKKPIKQWTCVITGGTSGVGLSVAGGMARKGAAVVLCGRNSSTGNRIVRQLEKETGNGNIEFQTLDLSSLNNIRQCADSLKRRYSTLELLSNNAAVLQMQPEITENGIEKIFQVNYLGHFLFTMLLLDRLKEDQGGRIITVSGSPSVLRFGKLDTEDLDSRNKFNFFKATLRAAYAKVAFSHTLSRLLNPKQVTSNTFHPGVIKSNLGRNLPLFLQWSLNLVESFLPRYSKTALYAAASEDLDNVSGAFIAGQRIVRFKPAYDLDYYADFLWQKSLELTGVENQEFKNSR